MRSCVSSFCETWREACQLLQVPWPSPEVVRDRRVDDEMGRTRWTHEEEHGRRELRTRVVEPLEDAGTTVSGLGAERVVLMAWTGGARREGAASSARCVSSTRGAAAAATAAIVCGCAVLLEAA